MDPGRESARYGKLVRLEAANTGPVAELAYPALRQAFDRAFHAKLKNPDYVALLRFKGIPQGFHDFPEEAEVKALRARIARAIRPAAGTVPVVIPEIDHDLPLIDGRLTHGEWSNAIELDTGGTRGSTRFLLLADRERLFFACSVPDDTTGQTFDQLRVYFHLRIVPELENERIHIDGTGDTRALRQTNIPRTDAIPDEPEQRLRNLALSDWNIYRTASGASQVVGHRQYEGSVALSEVGLTREVPFPKRWEVEIDPSRDAQGRLVTRNYAGQLGTDISPIWFVIGP
jgi:hypothetical protein